MKILLCFGTRPEAIKMAPIIKELKRKQVDFKVCVTAQHREMLYQVLDYFEIIPDYDLDLMETNQSLNLLSSNLFKKIDPILILEKPTLVLVHGDTTSSVLVAMAAFHREIKVGHVEAGLRTFNKSAPFPEELNRQLTTKIADFHFAPTVKASSNLLKENIPKDEIFITGNTVVDALQWAEEKMNASSQSKTVEGIVKILDSSKKLILVTGHRRESFGLGLDRLCDALLELANQEDVQIIYPVHLNPNVVKPIYSQLSNNKSIHLIDPVSYPDFIWLMKRCDLIISDSGGIQEEAPTFKKPVLVTREVTERMEGVKAGFSFLVGTDRTMIVSETLRLLRNPKDFSSIANPYGDGRAAIKIVENLRNIEKRRIKGEEQELKNRKEN